jgi:acyl-coenzyme A synthetase/AMP-(fatty) acid ligase
MDKIFLKDKNSIRYSDLINYVNGNSLHFLLSETESFILEEIRRISNGNVNRIEDLIDRIKSNNCSIILKTSGTTGKPKIIEHTIESISRNIKIDKKYEDVKWGLTYAKGKMAFYQVLLQALFNKSEIINLFGYSFGEISNKIQTNRVKFLSATPTFYRMLLSNDVIYSEIDQITIGGEGPTRELLDKLKMHFPNANVRNIYASSESASLFISKGEFFTIPVKYKDKVKIHDSTLRIHIDLLGSIGSDLLEGDWYDTQDLVEILDETTFKIIGRKNIEINVSGNKINPYRIEDIINSLNYVTASFVYSKKNSVTGNMLCCDIVLSEETEKSKIKIDLKSQLDKHEIPMVINFVESIDINSNMKINRV